MLQLTGNAQQAVVKHNFLYFLYWKWGRDLCVRVGVVVDIIKKILIDPFGNGTIQEPTEIFEGLF